MLYDKDRELVGLGLYDPRSPIRVKVLHVGSSRNIDEAFFAERIFGPLGMGDTFFQVPEAKVGRLADCYTMHPQKGAVMYDRGEASAWSRKPTQFSGGGGLVSTSADYHRFCRMLLNKGELERVRILSPKTVEFHLSRIYRKLGIGSRAELIVRFAGDGSAVSSA